MSVFSFSCRFYLKYLYLLPFSEHISQSVSLRELMSRCRVTFHWLMWNVCKWHDAALSESYQQDTDEVCIICCSSCMSSQWWSWPLWNGSASVRLRFHLCVQDLQQQVTAWHLALLYARSWLDCSLVSCVIVIIIIMITFLHPSHPIDS